MFSPKNVLKRYDDAEQDALLDFLLEKAVPAVVEVPKLVQAIDNLAEAKELVARKGEIIGLSTGFKSIDRMTVGMAPGDLIIVYGDTSHGKSQLTQNITYRIARKGEKVLFVGLEMTNAQNTTRFLVIGQGDYKLEYTLRNILYPHDNNLNLSSLEPLVAQGAESNARLVIIDQLQQLVRSIENNTNETSMITHELKRLAIKYQLPIILISHINRSGQTSAAPNLRELKGSSSIEQDADICIAVWRDKSADALQPDTLEVWLRKNRNRGMEFIQSDLLVQNGVRLIEPGISETPLALSVFPDGQIQTN